MSFVKIIPPMLIALFFLTGCADQNKNHGPTEASIQQRLLEQRRLDDLFYRSLSSDFESIETPLENKLWGDDIPEGFKGQVPPSLIQFYGKLEFKFSFTNYIKRVAWLNIGCDGRIEYEQFGQKFVITSDEFFSQVKWNAKKLEICGPLSIPEGHRLMLASDQETRLKDMELILNKNTFFSLWATNTEYEGVSPKLTLNRLSVIKLYFSKIDLKNLK